MYRAHTYNKKKDVLRLFLVLRIEEIDARLVSFFRTLQKGGSFAPLDPSLDPPLLPSYRLSCL